MDQALHCIRMSTVTDPSISVAWRVQARILRAIGQEKEACECERRQTFLDQSQTTPSDRLLPPAPPSSTDEPQTDQAPAAASVPAADADHSAPDTAGEAGEPTGDAPPAEMEVNSAAPPPEPAVKPVALPVQPIPTGGAEAAPAPATPPAIAAETAAVPRFYARTDLEALTGMTRKARVEANAKIKEVALGHRKPSGTGASPMTLRAGAAGTASDGEGTPSPKPEPTNAAPTEPELPSAPPVDVLVPLDLPAGRPPKVPLAVASVSHEQPVVSVQVGPEEVAGLQAALELLLPTTPVVLVKGLCDSVRFDRLAFSSSVVQSILGDTHIEGRTQYYQVGPTVWRRGQPTWQCGSTPVRFSAATYCEYQNLLAQRPPKPLRWTADVAPAPVVGGARNNRRRSDRSNTMTEVSQEGVIHFATNIDVPNEDKWAWQFGEIAKLPACVGVNTPGDMLRTYGHIIPGMNQPQMYMKVHGCKTTGHQENCNFCSININVGPGDCEWFVVDAAHWNTVSLLCTRYGLDFTRDAWWPHLQDLDRAGVPYRRFVQRPGELVYVSYGALHWVQSLGVTNNVSWNVAPLTGKQYISALERYYWNKLHNYHSIVPMETLSWRLATRRDITDPVLVTQLRYFLHESLKREDALAAAVAKPGHYTVGVYMFNDPAHTCMNPRCEAEVFNHLFVSGRRPTDVVCQRCSEREVETRVATRPVVVLRRHTLDELRACLERFEEYYIEAYIAPREPKSAAAAPVALQQAAPASFEPAERSPAPAEDGTPALRRPRSPEDAHDNMADTPLPRRPRIDPADA